MSNFLETGAPACRKLDAIQAKISELQGEIRGVERAPKALEDIRAEAARDVNRYRDPPASLDHAGIDQTRFMLHWTIALADAIGAKLGEPDIAVDVLVAERVRRIEQSGRPHGLPQLERKQRIEELQAQIRKLATDEEREVLRLEEQGYAILRRPDIDGKVVLEVWEEVFGGKEAA